MVTALATGLVPNQSEHINYHNEERSKINEIITAYTSISDPISKINWADIQVVGHRGGASVWPEHSWEGLRDVLNTGWIHAEVDLWELSDGTLVACHDQTVNRTMENIGTGNVSTKSRAQWRAAKILPPISGGNYGTPMFWSEVLDRHGGAVTIFVELKFTTTGTVTSFCQDIIARGLQKSVIVSTFDYTTASNIAAYGIPTMFNSANLPAQSGATMLAAGINYVCVSNTGNTTSGNVTTLKSAGMKVFIYTAVTQADYDTAVAKGPNGIFSDDPWMHAGMIRKVTSDQFHLGIRPKGSRFRQPEGTTNNGVPNDSPEALQMLGARVGLHLQQATPQMRTLTMPQFGLFNAAWNMRITIDFQTASSGQTNSIGIVLWNNSTAGTEFRDTTLAGQNFYTWVARRNGQIQAWKQINGGAINSLGSTTAASAGAAGEFAPAGKMGRVTLLATHSGTNFTLSSAFNSNLPPSGFTVADTNSFTNLQFALRWLAAGYVSDIGVTML